MRLHSEHAMQPTYRIIHARERDVSYLPAIELAAAQLLASHLQESELNDTTPLEHLSRAQTGGRLWVAAADDVPVGFAYVELLPSGAPHLEEIDVHPSHGRRGLGRLLIGAVCAWTLRQGHGSITLTTFRDVPFNQPFYERCGFEEVPASTLSTELVAIFAAEARRGLDPEKRLVMRWGRR